MATTIAHFSDLHIAPVSGFTVRHWNVKRALGFLNWHLKRRHVHKTSVLQALLRDAKARNPDHIVITGDLVNISTPFEYEQAARWLADVGAPDVVSVVPGNHDIYTPLLRDPGVGRWHAYMRSDEHVVGAGSVAAGDVRFPYVRRIGDVAIVGVNSAVPTAPGYATGFIDAPQLQELERLLESLGDVDCFRLVLVHHPPLPGLADARRRLRNDTELAEILQKVGAELVVYGHNHRDQLSWHTGRSGDMAIVGVSSASAARRHKSEDVGRYNLYTVARVDNGWQLRIDGCAISANGDSVVDRGRQSFDLVR